MYDLVVIGSGPGGYIAAIRAAQLGMKVACIERYATYGGTCLNVGCIPSKAMLESSERYAEVKHSYADHGIDVSGVELNLAKMMERKAGVVEASVNGINYLFKKNGVDGYHGHGSFVDKNTIKITKDDGTSETIEAKRVLIATGSKPVSLPSITIDKDRIIDSTGALELDAVPEHLLVIGAGVIGLELGSVWSRLGAKVTVLEYMPRILAGADEEVSKMAKRIFGKQGIDFVLEAKVTGAEVDGETVTVTYEDKKGEVQTISGDRLLVSVGRRAYTDGLGLDAIGLGTDNRGRVEVGHDFQTAVEGVYAIGDVIAGAMLAHKAEEEGVVCVELMHGIGAHINYDAIPDVVYTEPEVASVGKTEQELKDAGVPYKKGKFPFSANGRARALNATDGFVKILAHAETDRILGAHIIGIRAGDLIAELAVAMEFGAASEDIARSSHAHPTLAEIVKEAALGVEGRSLNI